MIKQTIMALIVTLPLGNYAAAEEARDPQCRGVAAGVVASMRADGDLSGEQAIGVANAAAQRACEATQSDFAPSAPAGDAEHATLVAVGSPREEENRGFWHFLLQNKELKPGHRRLRRLKTQ